MGIMRQMNHTGDRVLTRWDEGDAKSVRAASTEFDKAMMLGYTGIVDDPREPDGRKLKTFDPSVEAIMLVPRLQGG